MLRPRSGWQQWVAREQSRMVAGYLEALEPMDLHAWLEAYVGNRWYTFDPTRVDLQGGRVTIYISRV